MIKHKALLYFCIFLLLTSVGCARLSTLKNTQNSTGDVSGMSYRVAAVLPENNTIHSTDFWTYVWDGLLESADDRNLSLSEYSLEDSTSTSEYLDLALSAGVDGVILAPSGDIEEEILSLIQDARADGVKFVIIDTDIGDEYYDAFIGIDNEAAGNMLAEYVLNHWDESAGEIIILEPEASGAVSQRILAFKEYMASAGLDGQIVTVSLREEAEERLMDIQEAIKTTEDAEWIISFDPSCTIQAAETLSRMQLASELALIGFGESDTAEEYLEEGIIQALLIQDNYSMGATAAEKMSILLSGNELEETCFYADFSLLDNKG